MNYIIRKGEVISLSVAACPVIRVERGAVWLTREEDSRDYVFQRGDSFELGGKGTVVIEALADCAFEIGYPHAVPFQVTIYITPKEFMQEQ